MASPPYLYADWLCGRAPPKGWDAADAVADGWTEDDLFAFIQAAARPWTPPVTEKARKLPPAAAGKIIAADDGWQMELLRSEKGRVKPGATRNWALFLECHPDLSGIFAFDTFKMRVVLMRRPPWDPARGSWRERVLQDRDYSEAVMWLEGNDMTPKVASIAPVIQTVAEHARFDRLTDYLEGLVWDRRPRLHNWLTYYMGIEDTPYARTVGTRWLISSVARGLQPGCKVDTMPILEGPQGARKSTPVRMLYGDDFFTDELSDIGSKDAMMEMQGIWGWRSLKCIASTLRRPARSKSSCASRPTVSARPTGDR